VIAGPIARHPWKLPVVAGVVLALGFYPLGLVVPNLIALVPLLVWIDANLDRGWREWRNAGLAFGLTVDLLILNWMLSMLKVSFLGAFAFLGLALLFAAGQTLMVMALAWTRSRTGWPWLVLLPAGWLSLEWLQAQGDIGITAQHLGQTLGSVPFLTQVSDLAGSYGTGALLLASNVLVYEAWRSRERRLTALGAWVILVAAVLGYDAWAWTHPPASSGTLRISLIQPNVPLDVKGDSDQDEAQSRLLQRLTEQAAKDKPDLIIWPETARPTPIYHRPQAIASYAMPEVQALAKRLQTTIVTGAEYMVARPDGYQDAYNAVFVVHPDGRLDPVWSGKTILVPFVEAVPFRSLLGPLLHDAQGWARWLGGGFLPGPEGVPLPAAGTKVGVTVCFEEMFFDLQRDLRNAGARVQAVITNDAWFGRTYFQYYEANTVRLRAIENRSAFVRVANSGISVFVDPLGRDHLRTKLEEETVRTMEVPLTDVRTLYDRAGDVVAYAAIAMFVAAAAISWRRHR